MAINDTFFTSDSASGGSGSGDFVRDNFSDTSIPPSANTGFSSTILNNPLSQYFSNDDAPKYGNKTLWVKDLVLIEDRNKWVNNKPTYQVIFHENYPGAFCYVFGQVRLRNYPSGISVDLRNAGDGFGITGVMRRAAWLINPVQGTGSATFLTDGVANGVTANFGSAAASVTSNGVNAYNVYQHQTTNETQNIHDFRITADQSYTLNLAGVMVYFEDAGLDINLFPGATYVNKDKKTTTSLSTMALPAITGRNGARTVVYKTTAGVYASSTVETGSIETIGVGSSGTVTVNVTTGQGASFSAGSGVVGIASGSSYFIGAVSSVSTDTLTLGNTLPFGLSGPLYKAWQSGPTYAINASLYIKSFSFDPGTANVLGQSNGFGDTNSGNFYYSDPLKRYRAWGQNFKMQNIDGTLGVAFNGPSGFIQFDGMFSAADIQFAGQSGSVIHATLSVNGLAAYGLNEGLTNYIKKTVFTDAGPGWNSFALSCGASFAGLAITQVNMYQRRNDSGLTFGQLAAFNNLVNNVPRGSLSASFMDLGTYRRVFADELFLNGGWDRNTSVSSAGGVNYVGATTNSVLNFQYYGKDFALIGVAGSSVTVTLDGAGVGSTFNVFNTVATEGWHSVVMSNRSGSTQIHALDYKRTKGEFQNLQNFLPVPQVANIPTFYEQSDTPRSPKAGDIWIQAHASAANPLSTSIWIYLFGLWNRLSTNLSIDDPNLISFIRAHGGSTGLTAANFDGTAELFNFISWISAASDTVATSSAQNGEAIYASNHRYIDGRDTSNAIQGYHRMFNKTSWGTGTNRATARIQGGIAKLGNNLVVGKGSTTNVRTQVTATIDTFNGSSWTAGAGSLATASWQVGCFVQGSKVRFVNGGDSAGSQQNIHETWDGVSTSTDTVIGTASIAGGGVVTNVGGMCWGGTNAAQQAAVREWNGTAWSAAITGNTTVTDVSGSVGVGPAAGYNPITKVGYNNGGNNGNDTNSINTTWKFVNSSLSADVSSTLSRAGCSGGVL